MIDCLASTGFEVWVPLAIALAVIGLGVAFWIAARRSKKRGAAALGVTLLLLLGAGAFTVAPASSAQAAQPCPAPGATSAPAPTPTSTPAAQLPDFTPELELAEQQVRPSGTVTATLDLRELAGQPATGPITVDVTLSDSTAAASFAGDGWSVVSTAPGSAVLIYTPVLADESATTPLTITLGLDSASLATEGTITATIQAGSGGDSDTSNNTASVSYTVAAPDLTPSWLLPDPVYTTDAQVKTVVLTLSELDGVSTADGKIRFRVSKPTAFTVLPYDTTLTTATPTGGVAQTVSNSSFTVTQQTASFIIFTAGPNVGISADGSVSIALQIAHNSGAPTGTQNITATLANDPTGVEYDSNPANNLAILNLTYAPN